MAIDASAAVQFDSPFAVNIPPLGFEVLVPNCSPGDPPIRVAAATTRGFPVTPGQPTSVDVAGVIQGLSEDLTRVCPGMKGSPLDFLVKSYIHGDGTTVYVRGADPPSLATPGWVVDILKSVTVPLSFTGHALDNLVRNFTMSDVHFTLPDPFVEPDSPESQPTVSALVKVLIGLPKELGLQLDVPRVRATADVYYGGNKLGILNLRKWQAANSTLLDDVDGSPALYVDFGIKKAPLEVTDEDVLTDVLQDLIFQGKRVKLDVAASVDAEVTTGLGTFAVREIPAQGEIVVKRKSYLADSPAYRLTLCSPIRWLFGRIKPAYCIGRTWSYYCLVSSGEGSGQRDQSLAVLSICAIGRFPAFIQWF